uniref:Uncharacterized protein n=1 Tax=Terrapene triunguis TaxID=2587831 RepID=A0A674I5M2_9SAUR
MNTEFVVSEIKQFPTSVLITHWAGQGASWAVSAWAELGLLLCRRPWHRQDISANPRAHVVRAGRTKSRCWWATQPGCRCRVARGAWSCWPAWPPCSAATPCAP